MGLTTEAGESRILNSITKSSLRGLLPMKSLSSSMKRNRDPKLSPITRKSVHASENFPPPDPNIQVNAELPIVSPKKYQLKEEIVKPVNRSALEGEMDPSVKVVARIRPANEHEKNGLGAVTKVSEDSLSVEDRRFSFDMVLDSSSDQEEIFKIVGIPFVQSALKGYNVSILSYGQSGSGKTYTLWGPPSSMVDDPSPGSQLGIAPRMFEMLFAEIEQEKEISGDKHINYQCRCSFLEIYNDYIRDLLEPTQRNLQIIEDSKHGLHVAHLSEEYVHTYEDVTQILIKGLSTRKVGATCFNSKSSRSHAVFTLIIESWCKESSSTRFTRSKTSRISLVDLAGMDTNKADNASKDSAKEGKYVKKSISHLGFMVNMLAKQQVHGENSEKSLPFADSCLTHLLRDSLGGNAKLAVVCNISPGMRNTSETLRTLRFGQRAKCITNYPIINEISEDDVNDLSDQIRHLKDELLKEKADVHSSGRKTGSFSGRASLNQLRASLNRSLMLHNLDDDSNNDLSFNEHDMKELHLMMHKLDDSCGETEFYDVSDSVTHFSSAKENFEMAQLSEDEVNGPGDVKIQATDMERHDEDLPSSKVALKSDEHLSVSICRESAVLPEPTLSESPKIGNTRKSIAIPNHLSESTNVKEQRSSSLLRSCIMRNGSTNSLATSIQKGLEIIQNRRNSSLSNRSSVSFSFDHLALKSSPETCDGVHSSSSPLSVESSPLLCPACKGKASDADVSQEVSNVSNEVQELKDLCNEQAVRIEQLQQLVDQQKCERQMAETRSNLSLCQQPMIEENYDKETEHLSQATDTADMAKECCDMKEIQEVIDPRIKEMNTVDGADDDKEALKQEILNLRNMLKMYTDSPAVNKPIEKLRNSLLAQSMQLRASVDGRLNTLEENEERKRWTEMESNWILFADGLRVDLEASRQHAEQMEIKLKSEKKGAEELDDALRRAIFSHAKMVEHYVDLQEQYEDLVGRHRAMMEGVVEIKRAAAKAGTKSGNRFAKAVAAELSETRMQKDKEREFLRKENKNLKLQLRDTAEAVHAAGELLVKLRESEQIVSVAEENKEKLQEENDKLKKQIQKLKSKHKMEMVTMKQYMAESKLPESALEPLYHEDDADTLPQATVSYDDQAWRAEFGAIYQDHHF